MHVRNEAKRAYAVKPLYRGKKVTVIREIIYGKKRALRYWEITTDIETIPEKLTWYVMTQIPGVLAKELGNL